MKLLIIRHGDPDYSVDSLTPAGVKEAEALSAYLKNKTIDFAYVSPLGRAKKTAEYTLEAKGMTAVTCDWLREFPGYTTVRPTLFDGTEPEKNAGKEKFIPWDKYPLYLADHPKLLHPTAWREEEIATEGDVLEVYDRVVKGFDGLLASHGYEREGMNYRAVKPNHDTLAFFCHFGLESVLLSRLMNCSPFVPWQYTAAAPTSVTTVYTEEREQGVASFRVASFGDVSHLALAGLEPSFSARFCECFADETRH